MSNKKDLKGKSLMYRIQYRIGYVNGYMSAFTIGIRIGINQQVWMFKIKSNVNELYPENKSKIIEMANKISDEKYSEASLSKENANEVLKFYKTSAEQTLRSILWELKLDCKGGK